MFGNEQFSNRFQKSLCQRVLMALALFSTVSAFPVFADTAELENAAPVSSESGRLRSALSATVIGSRIPDYQVPFGETPAHLSLIPANISYKNEEEIYRRQPKNFQEALSDQEGLIFFDNTGNGVDKTVSMRGFNDGSSVIVLVDGVRVNNVDGDAVNYPLYGADDLEAIQIDRGSASPVYGSSAFGGVIHLTTGRPSKKPFSLFGGLEFSSFPGIRFYQGMSGTLEDRLTPLGGQFEYYFRGGRHTSNGFRDNGEYRITDFDIKTAYVLPENSGRVYVYLKHADDATSNPGSIPRNRFDENPEQTIKPLDGREMDNTILQIGAEKSFWENRFLASMMASWLWNETEFMTTSATFTDGSFNPDTDLVTTRSRATSLLWQLAYRDYLTEWLNNQTLIGMEIRDTSNRSREEDAFLGTLQIGSPVETDRGADLDNIALFWRETLTFFEKVTAHFGMRHDHYQLKVDDQVTPTDSISRQWSDSTLTTGVTYKPVPAADLFFNYSQGFRAPTVSEVAPFAGTVSANLQPEKTSSYEIGTRMRLKELAEWKLSWFLIDLEDEIVFDSTAIGPGAPFGANINIGESRHTGIETRLDLNPFPEIDAYVSYAWTRAYVRETDGGGSLTDGRTLGLVPEHRMTWGMDVYPLARACEPLEKLRVGFHGIYTGKQHPQSYESVSQTTLNATGGAGHTIKAYTVWDFILSYAWKSQEVYFKINNVFNERYYNYAVSATSFGTAIQPAGTFTFVNPGAPREFVFGYRYEFDSIPETFSNLFGGGST